MGEVGTVYLLSQFGYHAPALLVYLVAFVLALVYRGRAPLPSVLTLAGEGLLVATTLAVALVQAWLLDSFQAVGRDVSLPMALVTIVGSCARAVGLGLLVAAIFVGRRPPV